jgi:tripartite-type tricarboxylate transporter receptor subunit TctC
MRSVPLRFAVLMGTLCALYCAGVSAQSPSTGGAQSYPAKPVRIVAPFSPGGGTDLIGRVLAQELSALLGQPMLIDNRTGAGGHIGIEIVARANPDGHTLLFVNQTIATNEIVYDKLKYSAPRDFAPVSKVGEFHFILTVHPSLPVNSVQELTAYAKARPGKLTYASGGLGGVLYFAAEMYKTLAGVDVTHVPYRGGGDATTAVMANQVSLVYAAVPVGVPHIKSGRLKALAVTGAARAELVPQLPTMAESGVPGYEFSAWNMVLAPAGTPKTIVARLHEAVQKALRSDNVRESFGRMGVTALGSPTPEEARAQLLSEMERYRKLVKAIGLKLQ